MTLRGLWQRAFAAPRDYLWPIPATERDLNPNLEQNPGY
ncbi:MAG TPA: RagB/SusD family nutrient uptake outer membrane protein [Longimicrobiales bacterium]